MKRWAGVAAAVAGMSLAAATPASANLAPPTPIEHVVLIYQENHTFDNVLGVLCKQTGRCDGAISARLPNGANYPLRTSPDVVPNVNHGTSAQKKAVHGGAMDGWPSVPGCEANKGYNCLTQYLPAQISNLTALANQFVIADRTFQMDYVPTWGAHLELVAQTLNGFDGAHGLPGRLGKLGGGWGCDSGYDAPWRSAPGEKAINVPACVPDYSLNPISYPFGGAYRSTPVDHVPTIMDSLDAAGLSWKLYVTTGKGATPYGWAICPTFASCLYGPQHANQVPTSQAITDGENGRLPAFSVVLPANSTSQHNSYSMLRGDNWIGNVVEAIQNGPDWGRTAIFITYDDCGCFYDHVPPPPGMGLRVPMVIISPYAKRSYTDSNIASFSSVLTFTEHIFGLPPLTGEDANAYDYEDSFGFGQAVQGPTSLESHKVSKSSRRYMKHHPADPNDPT